MDATDPCDLLLASVRTQHVRAVDALDETTRVTERGVLAAGEILGSVVADRQAAVQEQERRLSEVQSDHAPRIKAAVEAQAALAEAYVTEVGPMWDETMALVSEALECASAINQCAARVAQVSKAMGILQMCCKSEIAHLGEAGVSFQSTVAEMRGLTKRTDDLNRRLERLASELASELPPIATLATAERRRTRGFGSALPQSLDVVQHAASDLVDRISESLRETRAADHALVAASHRALSALQFQDPLVQDLQRADSRIGELIDTLQGRPADDASYIVYEANLGEVAEEAEEEPLEGGDFLLF